jgi:hypothetical protein
MTNSDGQIKFFRIRGDAYVNNVVNIAVGNIAGCGQFDDSVVNETAIALRRRFDRISRSIATIAYRRIGDNVEYAVTFLNKRDNHMPSRSREIATGMLDNKPTTITMMPASSRFDTHRAIVADMLSRANLPQDRQEYLDMPSAYRENWVVTMFDLEPVLTA